MNVWNVISIWFLTLQIKISAFVIQIFKAVFFPPINTTRCTDCQNAIIKTYPSNDFRHIVIEFPIEIAVKDFSEDILIFSN